MAGDARLTTADSGRRLNPLIQRILGCHSKHYIVKGEGGPGFGGDKRLSRGF
jgi:hypothetical protein